MSSSTDFTSAIKSKDRSAITAAMDAAIAAKDLPAIQSACKYACGDTDDDDNNGTYDGTTLEALHAKVGERFLEGGAMTQIALQAKESYAEYLVIEKDDLHKAGLVLQPLVNPKSGTSVADDITIRATVKMIELFCYCNEFVQAESLMPKCVNHLRYNTEDKALKIRFLCTQAQVHEFKRRFNEAAQRFYEVSVNDPSQFKEALCRSAVCAVLAEPTDGRARMVGTIVNDDRAKGALGALLPVMTKIHQMRFLRQAELEVIKKAVINEAQLQGSPSILDTAVLTHNIKAVSQVYYNVSIVELAGLVGVTADEALRVVAQMITAGKINGTIDQVEDLITFHSSRDDACNRSDAQIGVVCNTLANLYETIKLSHPELAVM